MRNWLIQESAPLDCGSWSVEEAGDLRGLAVGELPSANAARFSMDGKVFAHKIFLSV